MITIELTDFQANYLRRKLHAMAKGKAKLDRRAGNRHHFDVDDHFSRMIMLEAIAYDIRQAVAKELFNNEKNNL